MTEKPPPPLGNLSVAALPLLADGSVVGVLGLVDDEPRRFSPRDAETFRVLADLLGSGIARARAEAATERLRAQSEAVAQASLRISDAMSRLPDIDLAAVLKVIVEEARTVVDAEYGALGIVGDPDQPFTPWVFSGVSDEQARAIGLPPRPIGTLGTVARQGEAIRVPDVREHPAFVGLPTHHPSIRSFLGVPIRFQGQSIGNLYLANKRGAREFTPDDQRAIESLAVHAGIAFQIPQLRRTIESQAARLQTILEGTPVGLVFVDAASGHLLANPAVEQILGRPVDPGAGRGQYVGQIHRPDGTPLRASEVPTERAFHGENVREEELLIVRPDGSRLPVLTSAAPVRGHEGDVIGAVVVFQDISTLKELERLREEWSSVIAHDLRQPITVITGYARLLERLLVQHADAEGTELRAIEHIQTATGNLRRMISDLLDVSRIEARRLKLDRQPIDLPDLVEEVVERTALITRGRSVRMIVHGLPPPVLADPGRIEQVLGNLLSNAAKYGNPATEIGVEVAPLDGQVRISVSNEGPGICPEDLPNLFARFYRAHRSSRDETAGLGLGLYISKGLIEAHGGRIWVESTPGETTTFHFTLPVAMSDES